MSHEESNRYVLNTLHRGRLIQILLAALFAVAFTVSRLPVAEMVKIIIVLFSLPAILFVSIRCSRQPSAWTLSDGTIRIDKNGVQHRIPLDDIAYVRNHIRSGGNMIAIHRKSKGSVLRFWRNKLFQADDDFDVLMAYLREHEVPYLVG